MPTYLYEVRDPKGKVLQGQAEAPTRLELVRELETLEYVVLGVREKLPLLKRLKRKFSGVATVSVTELALFTRQLSLLISAGVPILKSLGCLLNQAWSPRLRAAIASVMDGVRDGKGFSNSLARNPRAFGPVYVSLVRAGEVSGSLDEILKRLSDFLERDMRLYQRLRSSLAYPALVFISSVAMTAFMVLHVFPAFVSFFEGLSLRLPFLTRIVLKTSQLFTDPWVLLALLLVVPYLSAQAWFYFTSTRGGRRQWAWLILHTPVLSRVHRDVMLARFCRTLGILIECGVPQLHSLEVAGSVVGNEIVYDELQALGVRVRDGHGSLARELINTKFFPPECAHMLRVGEESGKMPRILHRLADFYETELDLSLQTALALIEPLMLTIMGGIVGFILLAVFMPIYSLLEAL
ncbi:type II secretion system F family protein [bacterium CPR1]|nr:type II secretion system F family protein [bacterium CPR1]